MSRRKIILLILVLGIAGGATWFRSHKASDAKTAAAGRKPDVVSVELTQARVGPVPVELSAMGQVVSLHTVNVQAQVTGTMTEVYITEGQTVAAGQKLFLIDPAPYRALVAQQQAQLARDRAALAAARSQAERLAPLAAKDFVTPQEYEEARAAAAQQQALVESDQAQLDTAQINLDRTLVRAPIAGRTGSLGVKPGNVVSPSGAAPLLSINQMDPIQVEFSVPQSSLSAVQQALAAGHVDVRISGEQPDVVLGEGRLVFVDNAVDTTTGTVKLKAECPNSEKRLWPGTFVTVTVILSVQQDAILLPEKAVQQGATSSFVFVVGEDRKAALRNVVVDRQVGSDVVISQGLQGGENVVAKVPRNLEDGTKVKTGSENVPSGQPGSQTESSPDSQPKGKHRRKPS